MQIDRLELANFKKYAHFELQLDPRFTLLVGDNAAGKTTLLEALAVAAGVWPINVPDTGLANSGRSLERHDIRLLGRRAPNSDRVQFEEQLPARVAASGTLLGGRLRWARIWEAGRMKSSNRDAQTAVKAIRDAVKAASGGETVVFPVIAYYSAGRAWHAANKKSTRGARPASRWAAYYDALRGRIRLPDLVEWFQREAIARGNEGGKPRPGYEAVQAAILGCLPGAQPGEDYVRYNPDRQDLEVSIQDQAIPFADLADGHRLMVAMVADLAIKAVTLNPSLLGANGSGGIFSRTPGLVLIDELDLHLHPRWQRHVAGDLQATFPQLQFVCTSHSPQIIGETRDEQIRVLDGGAVFRPGPTFGRDSNSILEDVMHARSRDEHIESRFRELAGAIDREELENAKQIFSELEQKIGSGDDKLAGQRVHLDLLEHNHAPDHEER